MRTIKRSFLQKFLTIVSHIKVFKWPLFIIYAPHDSTLKGNQVREVMKLVQPGDILVRFHRHALDGYLIPGHFSHAGFYLGEVTQDHLKQIAKVPNPAIFTVSEQSVIHATAKGVILDDLITFCHCDGLAVVRFPRQLKLLENRQLPERIQTYFKEFNKPDAVNPVIKAESDIAQLISSGKTLEFSKAFKVLFHVALGELGTPYDFNFDFDHFQTMSCTELVYFITKSLIWNYGIEPYPKRIFFKKHRIIEPDRFILSDLEEVWKLAG